jgi:hypothetical protein
MPVDDTQELVLRELTTVDVEPSPACDERKAGTLDSGYYFENCSDPQQPQNGVF